MSDDLDGLRAELIAQFGALAEALVGEAPNRALSTKRTLRFYCHGGLAVEMAGAKRGTWFSHSASEGGGPFQLIRHLRRCSFGEAIRWARDWTGEARHTPERTPPVPIARPLEAGEAAEEAKRIGAARRLWDASGPLDGTPADVYLTATRAIPRAPAGWPDAVLFHAPSRSLILAATTADGAVQAVQRVRLTPDGRKAEGTAQQPTKQTNGVLADAAVRLPGHADRQLLLAEGPETGLSVWAATGHETWIALGSVSKIVPPSGRAVVLCRDDDKTWSPADRKLRKTLAKWRGAGLDVRLATPWPERRQDASDFNDTIRAGGADAVRARIAAALDPALPQQHRLPVAEARRVLDAKIRAFFAAADAHDPKGTAAAPVHAIRVDVGAGKSTIARQRAAEMLAAMRERDDMRTIVLAVPTHRLGDDQAAAFEALPAAQAAELTAAVWRGRERDDPDAPGETMCRAPERVKDATDAMLPVQSSVCKRRNQDGTFSFCPLFDACGYQRQMERRADLWILAHELLFTQKPAAIGDIAAVIVDESAWQDGLTGAGGADVVLPLDTLRRSDPVPFDPAGTLLLGHLRSTVLRALSATPDGPVQREAMLQAPLPAASAAEANKLEWLRKTDPGMHPGMSDRDRKAALALAAGNKTIARLGLFWRALEALTADGGPGASGWVSLGWHDTREGPVRALVLKGRKPARGGWQAPMLLIDAVLNIDLVRHHWPAAELVADVAIAAPHQRISQVTDCSFSQRRLLPWDGAPEPARRAGARNMRDLHATIATIGRAHAPGRVLAVAQKDVEAALPGIGRLPPNIVTAHHNNVAGRDVWRAVTGLIVVGRTAPSPAAVERIAEALTGCAVTPLGGWYERTVTGREMADGEVMEAEADRHPDPTAEAIRWHVCEAELIQIIGRGRGVNRTAADPLDVLVLTDVPLPLPVNGTLALADLAPSPTELMLAAGGVAFENPTDAAAAYPTIWENREAAKKALDRSAGRGWGHSRIRHLLIRVCPQPPLLRLDYQPQGIGKKPAVARCCPRLVMEPAAALAEAIGPLALCRPAGIPFARAGAPLAETLAELHAGYWAARLAEHRVVLAEPRAPVVITLPAARDALMQWRSRRVGRAA